MRRKPSSHRPTAKPIFRINYQIQSPTIRLLTEDGKQVGIVGKIEALQRAKELGVDVVEVAPNAQPPVAKLIDFKKFKYQEARKEREQKKHQKNVSIKEVRLRPFIGQHDLDTRLAQAREFLEEGNQVKINVMFRGREITRKEFGEKVISQFLSKLDLVRIVREPHMEGRTLSVTIISDKKNAKAENEKNNS